MYKIHSDCHAREIIFVLNYVSTVKRVNYAMYSGNKLSSCKYDF